MDDYILMFVMLFLAAESPRNVLFCVELWSALVKDEVAGLSLTIEEDKITERLG